MDQAHLDGSEDTIDVYRLEERPKREIRLDESLLKVDRAREGRLDGDLLSVGFTANVEAIHFSWTRNGVVQDFTHLAGQSAEYLASRSERAYYRFRFALFWYMLQLVRM